MAATIPPQLLGPRMAVWGYFPFDGRVIDADGTHADWDWAMKQWDRVVQAGSVVRLVVADQPYSRIDTSTPAGASRLGDAQAKFTACTNAEQLVFGRVYVAGGKLGLGAVGTQLDDPLRPGHQVPAVAEQIDAWQRLYGNRITGIYLDSGPVDCTDPARPGSVPGIPDNYRSYVLNAGDFGYRVFVQVAQYPDNQPLNPWVQGLGADFLEIWEAGVLPYRSRFQARDACRPDVVNPGVPPWWDPGAGLRWSRVHVINDCRDADTMRSVATLAVGDRKAGTVWITRSRQDPNLGTVFDVLPPYWDDEVAFFREFLNQDEKQAKDTKEDKDAKEDKEHTENKENKDDKDDKDSKESKESKDDKDGKDYADKPDKDTSDTKNAKDEKDDAKDNKDDKDGKDNQEKPDKDAADNKDPKDAKEDKDNKDAKEVKEEWKEQFDFSDPGIPKGDRPLEEADAAPHDETVPPGGTFIRAAERPEVGASVVADPTEPEERQ